jgi:hypothetical protein
MRIRSGLVGRKGRKGMKDYVTKEIIPPLISVSFSAGMLYYTYSINTLSLSSRAGHGDRHW